MKIGLKILCTVAFFSVQANAAQYELYCPQTVTVKNDKNGYSWNSTDNYSIWLDPTQIYWDEAASKPSAGSKLTYSFFIASSSFTGTEGYQCSYRSAYPINQTQLTLVLKNSANIVKIADDDKKDNWTPAPFPNSNLFWCVPDSSDSRSCHMTLKTQ